MKLVLSAVFRALACASLANSAIAQGRRSSPEVWMVPPSHSNGACFRELFEQPDAWRETRSRVRILGYADHVLNRQFTDDELGRWLPKLKGWGVKLALEVGAIKPWGTTGQKVFDAQKPMWDRFQRLGAKIHAIALDEPLCCVRNDLKKPDEYAVEETARFIALVRKAYPEVLIGDIEPYPFVPEADLRWWIDSLEARLRAKCVRGMDFFRLDVDWISFTLASKGSWPDVRKIEEHCRATKLPFSLILWASDWPWKHSQHKDAADTWHQSCLKQLADYTAVGGTPDQIVIESWIETPAHSVPETQSDTFAFSVLDIAHRVVKRRP